MIVVTLYILSISKIIREWSCWKFLHLNYPEASFRLMLCDIFHQIIVSALWLPVTAS